MAGIVIMSKTDMNTVMVRFLSGGKLIDTIEVENVIFMDEEDIAGKTPQELIDYVIRYGGTGYDN